MPSYLLNNASARCLLCLVFISAFFSAKSQSHAGKLYYLANDMQQIVVDPETFSIRIINTKNEGYEISAPGIRKHIDDVVQTSTSISWATPEEGVHIHLKLSADYLDVSIKADHIGKSTWPVIGTGIQAYTIPFQQGKYIPASDTSWIEQMVHGGPFSGSQDLSMQFFAVNYQDSALVYIIKNMFNNKLAFYREGRTLGMKFIHEFPETVKDKEYGFRVFLTKNTPVDIARLYKRYVTESGHLLTLEDKAKGVPGIRKLYGAPHIYIWNTESISSRDILKWKLLKSNILRELTAKVSTPTHHLMELFRMAGAESGKEFLSQLNEFKQGDYVIKYHQALFIRALNEALLRKDFYDAEAWKNCDVGTEAQTLITKGINNLGLTGLYHLNQLLLFAAYPSVLQPVQDWGGAPPSILDELHAAGIGTAWLGLDDWVGSELHPAFTSKALALGYLIGPYDSYHSMHAPGKERWLTAKFEDTSLYTKAFVTDRDGKPHSGFLGEGRQLNPVLSMPSVKERVTRIMNENGNAFNSWFIDCDATGEIFDDYTPGRMTDQQEDLEARLVRMSWIRDTYKMVIGSEVGNDFAETTIAFGHGMTTPIVEWNDPDMRKNKTSKYFVGSYFSNTGGIPGRYILPVLLKDKYLYTYFDNRFNVPLFQLVYNNAEITSHHWEWGSLKVTSEIKNISLKEILYNVPPLYHLDQENWEKYKDIIIRHVHVFSRTHTRAVRQEMTSFEWLSNDRFVQKTVFGSGLEMIANFGNISFSYKENTIPGHAMLIHDLSTNKFETYKP